MGVQFTRKSLKIKGDDVELIIWDIAGQDSFMRVRRKFYEEAEGVIIVYDTTRKSSLKNVLVWYEDVIMSIGEVSCVLIGNKIDLEDKIEVTNEDVISIMSKVDIEIELKTSAKTGENVEEGFYSLAKSILEKHFRR